MQHTSPFLFSISLALLLSLSPFTTHAQQQFTPTTYYGVQSVFVEGKALYIHGGRSLDKIATNPPSNQTFLLDLSTSWSTDKPVFYQLPSGFPSEGATSTMFNNKTTWFLSNAATQAVVLFDIQRSAWGPTKIYNSSTSVFNMAAVADPLNNSVYIVNGWRTDNNPANTPRTLRYDEVTGMIYPVGNEVPIRGGHSAVWSSLRSSILVYGKLNSDNFIQRVMLEYSPITEVYTPVSDKGDIPAARYGHCMVEAYGGTKIIVFGGITVQGTSSEIFMFDVATLTWTQLTTGPPSTARAYAACAVTNDRFIAWGGATYVNRNFIVVDTPTIVYNFKANGTGAWQTTYSPDKVLDDGSSNSTIVPVGAIIGGSVGALFLIVFVGGFLIHRRKQRRRDERHSLSREGENQGSGSGSEASIRFNKREGDKRGSYVVHAPVTEVCAMAPTGFESTAYSAAPCPQTTTQAQIFSPVAATPVVDGSLYYASYAPPIPGQTQQVYDHHQQQQQHQQINAPNLNTATTCPPQQQGYPIIYQPPLATQPSHVIDSPQYQYQVPVPQHPDPSAGYAMVGYSPPTAAAAAASEPAVTVGSKDEIARRNPQGSERSS
ncbi:Multiple epidermal growth factor-like domains protein 8 [Mortierella sp. 14UC]|nr:Multiple epidermal growth factor-like domains protein 8 [Mortierella sp. 14UC]